MRTLNGRRGQTLIESLMVLPLLLLMFFCVFYTFLIGMEKIKSIDTVYHLARVQQVKESTAEFMKRVSFVTLQCFGLGSLIKGSTQVIPRAGTLRGISEVSFDDPHMIFSLRLHAPSSKSIMRVAQPDVNFLTASYPGAAEDKASLAQLIREEGEFLLEASRSSKLDGTVDALEEVAASLMADKP